MNENLLATRRVRITAPRGAAAALVQRADVHRMHSDAHHAQPQLGFSRFHHAWP